MLLKKVVQVLRILKILDGIKEVFQDNFKVYQREGS